MVRSTRNRVENLVWKRKTTLGVNVVATRDPYDPGAQLEDASGLFRAKARCVPQTEFAYGLCKFTVI
jgi:hypothetical protein